MTDLRLSEANEKVIKSLKSHLKTGYEADAQRVNALEIAIRQGKISLGRSIDDLASFADLAGDVFDPEVNDNIDAAQLKREEKAFKARINRSGSWVFESSFWTGREWEYADVIGGFVGWDFIGSGYEAQVLEAALDAYNKQDLDAEGFVIDPFRNAA
jgi:hypothetical protein